MRRSAGDPRALAGGRHARAGTDHGSRLAPPSRRCGSPWPSISAPTGSRSGTNALVTSAHARDGAGMLARPMRACRRVRAGRPPSGRKHARRRPRGWLAERTGLDRRKRSVSSRSAAEVCWNAPSRLPMRRPLERWDRTIATNLKGVWLCMKYEIPQCSSRGAG